MKKSGRKTERWKRALALCLCSVLFISGLHGTYSTRANDEFGDGGGVDGLNSEFGSGDGQMSVEPEATETPTATPTEIPTEMPTATPTETLMEPEVTPAGPAVLTYSDLAMNVEVTEVNGGSIQEGTTVSFDAVQADDTAYTAAVNMLNEKAAKENREVKSLLAYKLSLADASGTELDIPVNVKVTYISPADMENPELAKADIKAVSWRLDEAQNLTVTDLNAKISSTENKAIETAEFKMDKPGVIAFDWEAEKTAVEPEPTETPDGTEAAPTPTPESTENPDGTEVTLTPTPETPENPDGTEAAPTPTPESTEIPDGTEVPPLTPEPEPTETPDETEATPTPTETPDETEVTPIPTPEIETQKQIEITVDEVNIRAAASVEAESIGKEVKGTRLILLDTEQDADGTLWYKIDYNGVEAYVRADTASVILAEETEDDTADDGENEPDNNKEETPQITEVKITAESANIHAEASTESDVLGTAAAEATFQLTETITGEDGTATWYAIVYNEATGYVEAANAEVVEAAPAVITRYDYKSDDVNVLVTLTNPEDLPDDAELVVTPVELSVEAEENVTEEAIKEEKAIEKIIAYDIKFVHPDPENPDKKIEVQPGATVQVSVTVPEIKAGQEAAVYHVDDADQVENMDGAVDKNGDVVFETEHFSIYVIVQQGDKEVEVTIEHLYKQDNEVQKIYSDDKLKLPVGGQINNYAKATNWNVDEVYVGNKAEKEENPENIKASSNTTVKVYYTPKVTISPDNPVTFYDYTVKADGSESDQKGTYSINMEACYADGYVAGNSNEKLIVGNTSANYSQYRPVVRVNGMKYDGNNKTSVSNVHANLWEEANKNVAATELLSHVDKDKVYFNYKNPGFFTNSDKTVNGRDLRKVYKGYKLEFERSGDKWTLNAVYNAAKKKVSNAGNEFWPLDDEKPDYESRKNDNLVCKGGEDHNNYFGMRYDINFSLGDYVGDLNYKFTGDDDLWVVLDGNNVVIDLGGIHNALTDQVDLWDHLLTPTQIALKEKGGDDWIASLTKEQKNKEHTLTVLYMERGSWASNCYMEFTVPQATIAEVTKVPMADLTFKKLSNAHAPLSGARFALVNDETGEKVTATSDSSGTVSFTKLRKGTYTMTEEVAPSGYLASTEQWKVIVKENGTTATAALYKEDGSTPVAGNKIINYTQHEEAEKNLVSNKTAKVVNEEERIFQIDLNASTSGGEEGTPARAASIVLVLDASGSMGTAGMNAIKTAAKSFIKKTKERTPGSEIAVVWYKGTEGYRNSDWNNEKEQVTDSGFYTLSDQNANALNGFINNKDHSGGTPMGAALKRANDLLDNSNNDAKFVVLFTDGLPGFNADIPNLNCMVANNAYNQANEIKQKATLYTVGYNLNAQTNMLMWHIGHSSSSQEDEKHDHRQSWEWWLQKHDLTTSATDFLQDYIATQPYGEKTFAYTTDNADGLNDIFDGIAGTIGNLFTLQPEKIVDVIDARFELTPDSKTELKKLAPNVSVTENLDGTTTITWTGDAAKIGNSGAQNENERGWSASFQIKAKDDFIGGNMIPTNGAESGIYLNEKDEKISYFKQPSVNVKLLSLDMSDKEVTVYKGDTIAPADFAKVLADTLEIVQLDNETTTTLGIPEWGLTGEQLEAFIRDGVYEAKDTPYIYPETNEDPVGYFKYTYQEVTKDGVEVTPLDLKSYRAENSGKALKHYKLTAEYIPYTLAERKELLKNTKIQPPVTGDGKAEDGLDENSDGTPDGGTEVSKDCIEPVSGTCVVNVISGKIQITKKLNQAETEDRIFKFKVEKETGEVTDEGKPVTELVDEIEITVPANRTEGFYTVPDGTPDPLEDMGRGTYIVSEVVLDEYDLLTNAIDDKTDCENKVEGETAVFTLGNSIEGKNVIDNYKYDPNDGGVLGAVTFENQKAVKKWEIVKVSKTSSNLTVPGAGFTLTNKDDKTKYYTGVSGDNGVVAWKNADQKEVTKIPEGTYTLKETAAPTGYMLSTETWEIVITSKGSITSVTSSNRNFVVPTKKGETDIWQYQFANEAVYDLPSAGGTGIYWYTISGVLFMMAAALILYKNRCRETVKK